MDAILRDGTGRAAHRFWPSGPPRGTTIGAPWRDDERHHPGLPADQDVRPAISASSTSTFAVAEGGRGFLRRNGAGLTTDHPQPHRPPSSSTARGALIFGLDVWHQAAAILALITYLGAHPVSWATGPRSLQLEFLAVSFASADRRLA